MNGLRKACILGTGSYIPERVVTNNDLSRILDTSDEWIRTRTGIRERHLAAENESASDMAVKAAERALKMSGIPKHRIGFIILATGTPDYPIPNTSSLVQDKLGLPHAGAVDISAGCAGFIHGLVMAKGLVSSGLFDYGLVISSEMLSKHLDWKDRTTCILFGDGAGAAVVGPDQGKFEICSSDMGTDGSCWDCIHIPAGGTVEPVSEEAIRKDKIYLKMNGRKVFQNSVRRMIDTAAAVMAKEEITADEVGLFLFHQANIRIIQCVAKKMGIPWGKIPIELDRLGNTGPASVAIALDLAVRDYRIPEDGYILLDGFGAGFIWSSVLLRIEHTEKE